MVPADLERADEQLHLCDSAIVAKSAPPNRERERAASKASAVDAPSCGPRSLLRTRRALVPRGCLRARGRGLEGTGTPAARGGHSSGPGSRRPRTSGRMTGPISSTRVRRSVHSAEARQHARLLFPRLRLACDAPRSQLRDPSFAEASMFRRESERRRRAVATRARYAGYRLAFCQLAYMASE